MTDAVSLPLVSVVLPTFNGIATLPDAVRSILRQTYGNLELIVVDDASTQDIPAALAEFSAASNLRYIRNAKNSGLAASLNAGIAAARGDLIARMDDDDYSLPERIIEQVRFLQARSDVDVVGAGVAFYDRDLTYIGDHLFPGEHPEIMRFLCRGNPLAHPVVMFRRTFIARAGGYDASLRRMEDLDLWGRMALTSRYANLPKVLLRHRVRPSKTLSAVPPGIRIRMRNGRLLGHLSASACWTLVYAVIEVLRHWGYRQQAFRSRVSAGTGAGFLD